MSSDTISLDLQIREVRGKAVKRLREDGLVPAVIHDHGKPSIEVQGEYQAIFKAYQQAGKHHPIALTAGKHRFTVLIRDIERDPRKNTLSHLVFNAVKANEQVSAEVPIRPRYAEDNDASPAERAGLLVIGSVSEVTVEATPSQLPDELFYDAEKLAAVGDSLTVADLTVPAGVTMKTDAETVIATVFEPSAVAAANDAAGGDASVDDLNAEREVPADHDTNVVPDDQQPEIRTGGKKEFEDKNHGHGDKA